MAPAPERLHFGWAMKGSQTSIWLSRIRRKSHIPGVYHFPHPPNILTLFVWCRYWVSSEKSGLRSRRMAASVCWAGIGMLYGTNASGLAWTSWQYNFTLFLLSLSISLCLSLSLNKLLALHLHHNHPGVEEEVWIRPKHTIMSAKPWLPADHYGSTMEIKSVKRRKREREKKKNNNKKEIQSTSYASHFHSLCAFNVWKRIAERMSRSKKK